MQGYAAGIPRQIRMVYLPAMWNFPKLTQLEPGVSYRAFLFDPSTAKEHSLGTVKGDASGEWQIGTPAIVRDWVLVLDAKG